MSPTLTVFVNARPVEVPAGAVVLDAVRAADQDLFMACRAGAATVTDGRALPLALDSVLSAGAILRVARARRRGPDNA